MQKNTKDQTQFFVKQSGIRFLSQHAGKMKAVLQKLPRLHISHSHSQQMTQQLASKQFSI